MGKLAKSSSSGGATRERGLTAARRGLADALFTTTQQRVLGLLFCQPERSFYASEVIGRARVGSGAVQRELARLVDSGLVRVSRIGRQKHYRANTEAPVFRELQSLLMKTVGVADPIREALEPLFPKIKLALIYGSVARGADRATSDIDVLVVSDHLSLEDLYDAVRGVENRLARSVNVTLYSTEEFRERRTHNSSFLSKILRVEHIVLHGRIDASAPSR
jgi:predicted nucleotidyltransferase